MLEGLKLRLVDDWRQAWKWSSVRLIALGSLGSVIELALMAFPDKLLQYVPQHILAALTTFALACMILAGLGRITTTEPRNEPEHFEHTDADH